MRSDLMHRACFATAVAMFSAAGVSSAATSVYLETNLSGPTEGNRFLALVNAELHRPPTALLTWGTGLAGRSFTSINVDAPTPFDSYAMFGRTADGGVYVSFSSPSTASNQPFETMFPGISEGALSDQLLTDGPLVTEFANQIAAMSNVSQSMEKDAGAIKFTTGTPFGTVLASFTPIPEPASAALMAIGGMGILARRRRQPA